MICHSRRVLYLHPAKTAGTSVEKTLLKAEIGSTEPTNAQRQVFAVWTGDARQHWPYGKLTQELPFLKEWPSFCTVRHPYSRAVSEFKYQLDYIGKADASESHRLRDVNLALASGDFFRCADVWHADPQCSYIGPDTKLIRFENLAEDFFNAFGLVLDHHDFRARTESPMILNDESKIILQNRYARDFEILEYLP